jgi:hypothetical protein
MMRSRILLLAILILILVQISVPSSLAEPGKKFQIESGFNLLYQLKFGEARKQFADWQWTNPKDPLGYIAMAASYLFEEFYDQHVLTSEFFLNDESLLGGIRGKPNEGRKVNFEAANQKGKNLALKLLSLDSRDDNALFALTIATGMQADFAAILEKRQIESLSLIKEAEGYAKRLLVLQPDEADALLSLGATNYIIGSLPAYKRFFLWFGQVRGDKHLGLEQLRIAAEKGHYLKPFAQIFLALAAMREKQEDVARSQLRDLAVQFPENPLFKAELARLDSQNARSNHGEQ